MVKSGRYGPYVSSGEKNPSLLSTMAPDSVSLDDALQAAARCRARSVTTPEGVEIIASGGRYGPYIKRGDDTRSLASEDQLFTVTLEEALALAGRSRSCVVVRRPARRCATSASIR